MADGGRAAQVPPTAHRPPALPSVRRHRSRLRLTIGLGLLVFVACMVLLATVLLLLLDARLAPNGPVGSGLTTPPILQPTSDVVFPYNLAVAYDGIVQGYFGPSSLPPCGTGAQGCLAAPGGHFSVPPLSDFHWNLTLQNRDANASHWIEIVTVGTPFALQDVYPSAPMLVCAGCVSSPIDLLLLSPSSPGPYYLTITVTTFD